MDAWEYERDSAYQCRGGLDQCPWGQWRPQTSTTDVLVRRCDGCGRSEMRCLPPDVSNDGWRTERA